MARAAKALSARGNGSRTLVLVPPRGRFIAVHLGVGALD
jgi:hypothetical protein